MHPTPCTLHRRPRRGTHYGRWPDSTFSPSSPPSLSGSEVLVTGGLGKLMQVHYLESWLCYRDHVCSSPENFMCWVYDEKDKAWLPWDTNFDLQVAHLNPSPFTLNPKP